MGIFGGILKACGVVSRILSVANKKLDNAIFKMDLKLVADDINKYICTNKTKFGTILVEYKR